MNKINWKEELLDSANFNKKQEGLLKNSTTSFTYSWILGVLHSRWKKLKGFRDKERVAPDRSFVDSMNSH
tara:strand:+ start:253 stop:462 length:210 start_codon:yes stop_codon:yes gene_type:complete